MGHSYYKKNPPLSMATVSLKHPSAETMLWRMVFGKGLLSYETIKYVEDTLKKNVPGRLMSPFNRKPSLINKQKGILVWSITFTSDILETITALTLFNLLSTQEVKDYPTSIQRTRSWRSKIGARRTTDENGMVN